MAWGVRRLEGAGDAERDLQVAGLIVVEALALDELQGGVVGHAGDDVRVVGVFEVAGVGVGVGVEAGLALGFHVGEDVGLFLDEVGAGVNRTLLNTIGDAIVRLNKERGYTFCVIEHDMDFIGRLCDPVICMAEGKVLAQGTVDEVKNNEKVIEAYLGTGLKNKVKEAANG